MQQALISSENKYRTLVEQSHVGVFIIRDGRYVYANRALADMFLSSPLKICGEVELRVHQHLLSRTGRLDEIERVYSHPMSLAQCQAWLRQHLPKAERLPVVSNAEAARRARHADDAAAIAGESAGHVYGLRVVAGPIEDRPDNTTRFLVLGRKLFEPSGRDKTSLLVSVKDRAGALYELLTPLWKRGINMRASRRPP